MILSIHDKTRIISALEMKAEVYKDSWGEPTKVNYKTLIEKIRSSLLPANFGKQKRGKQLKTKRVFKKHKKQNGKKNI